MAESQDDFTSLMQRVRQGSQDAAREVLERYGPHIVRVIRRRLSRQLRSKFDSTDFVQAVWASFFGIDPQKHTFDSPEALMAFLAAVARNKVIEAYRQRRQYQKYDVSRERSLDSPSTAKLGGPAARQPTPSQAVSAREQWDRLLAELPPQDQRVLELLREGHTHVEVARILNLNEKTVRRVIDRVAERVVPP